MTQAIHGDTVDELAAGISNDPLAQFLFSHVGAPAKDDDESVRFNAIEDQLVTELIACPGGISLAVDKLRLVLKRALLSGDYADAPLGERQDYDLIASAIHDLKQALN